MARFWKLSAFPMIIVLMWFGLSGCCPGVVVSDRGAANAIKKGLSDSVKAWNQGNLEEFMAPYASNARFVTSKGVTYGRQKILSRYQNKYANKALMGTLAIDVQHITFNPGENKTAATVIGRWRITRESGEVLQGATLIVYHRLAGQWLIVEDHSS